MWVYVGVVTDILWFITSIVAQNNSIICYFYVPHIRLLEYVSFLHDFHCKDIISTLLLA